MGEEGQDGEDKLLKDIPPNPFIFKSDLRWYRLVQVMVMSVTVAPLRSTLCTILQVIGWLISVVALCGITDEHLAKAPLRGWRRTARHLTYKLGRVSSMISGFTFVTVKGTQARPVNAPTLVAAPHSSLMDSILIFLMNECPGIVTKEEIRSYPLVGNLLRFSQPVLVSREDAHSKQEVIAELKRRCNSNGLWHQTLIFPEGTTTNRQALLPFKRGAFVSGQPVQPVTMTFTDDWDTVTWTWIGGPAGWLQGWFSMCKFNIGLTVEFLDVYYPSKAEIDNPNLYAENVRKVMAQSLQVPCSDLTLEDARKMAYEKKML